MYNSCDFLKRVIVYDRLTICPAQNRMNAYVSCEFTNAPVLYNLVSRLRICDILRRERVWICDARGVGCGGTARHRSNPSLGGQTQRDHEEARLFADRLRRSVVPSIEDELSDLLTFGPLAIVAKKSVPESTPSVFIFLRTRPIHSYFCSVHRNLPD